MDQDPVFTPAAALDSLPEIEFNPQRGNEEEEFRRAELLQSVLAIARVDHVSESELVREVVQTSLGHVPDIEG
jgi:hypothetical protein